MVGRDLIEVGPVWVRRLALCLVVALLVSCSSKPRGKGRSSGGGDSGDSGDGGSSGSSANGGSSGNGGSSASSGSGDGATGSEVAGSGGEGGVAGSAGGRPTLSIQEFIRQYNETYCGRVLACCTQAEASDRVDLCIAGNANLFGAATDALLIGAEQGRLALDEDAARACVEALGAMSCQQYADTNLDPLSCPSLVKPRAAIGDSCFTNHECISGSCERVSVEDVGSCGPMPGPGEECRFWNCPKGYFCDEGATGQVCTALRANGETCQWDYHCESNNCGDFSLDNGSGYCAPPFHSQSCNGGG
jgi:hypothetical protein